MLRHGGNGDGTLFYPGMPARIGGKSDIPVESIRLKLIREGLEDYEYFLLLGRTRSTTGPDGHIGRVVHNTHTFEKDPNVLSAERLAMGEAISRESADPPRATPGGRR